ncbi:metallophosphoesterase [Arcanobacterium canis]
MKFLTAAFSAAATAGVAVSLFAYAHAHRYVVRHRRLDIADAVAHAPSQEGLPPLRILHLSDMHLIAADKSRADFLRSLRHENPDFVIATGDFVGENAGIQAVLDALDPLLDLPGAFVFGSNDYYGSRPKNPFSYLIRDSSSDGHTNRAVLDSHFLRSGLTGRGWFDLTNTTAATTVAGHNLELFGVDDPHMGRDRMPHLQTRPDDVIRIAVTHAPYVSVLDEMHAAQAQIIFSGHTHGGQVSLPGGRALVTNCDLPTPFAHGLFQWPPSGTVITTDGDMHLPPDATAVSLSAGIGTSPYVPLRLFTAPEAIIIDIDR